MGLRGIRYLRRPGRLLMGLLWKQADRGITGLRDQMHLVMDSSTDFITVVRLLLIQHIYTGLVFVVLQSKNNHLTILF